MADNYISKKEESGTIFISDEVIGSIVRSAVLDVDGVAGLSNAAGTDFAELIGIKTLGKGIKVLFEENALTVEIFINVNYGNNLVEVAQKVQASVTSSVQSVTGIENSTVNVHVIGISF